MPPQQVTQKKVKGFSLIELMVVMAIMAILMSLSGGLMQKSINQQARQVELEQVRQLFKKLSYQAYYGGGAMQVRLEKNTMQIAHVVDSLNFSDKEKLTEAGDEQYRDSQNSDNSGIGNPNSENQDVETINFEQLTFVAQNYNVSSKGIVSPNQYQVFWLEGIKTFELKSLFSELAL